MPLNTIAHTLGYDVVEAERGRVAIALVPTGAHRDPRVLCMAVSVQLSPIAA
jgi:hypothetical protein